MSRFRYNVATPLSFSVTLFHSAHISAFIRYFSYQNATIFRKMTCYHFPVRPQSTIMLRKQKSILSNSICDRNFLKNLNISPITVRPTSARRKPVLKTGFWEVHRLEQVAPSRSRNRILLITQPFYDSSNNPLKSFPLIPLW